VANVGNHSHPRRGRGQIGACGTALALVALLLSNALESSAETTPSREYQIKAVFLFNFAQFVEWPATAFASPSAPLCIGVLGKDPFGSALDDTVQGETIRNRKLIVQRSNSPTDLKNCQLVYVSDSERARVPEVLSALTPQAVLTVSDIESFARRGGAINFYLEGNKVRFEINPNSARREGIKISSQLLALGRIIESEPGKEER
jgi:hypothetical protein